MVNNFKQTSVGWLRYFDTVASCIETEMRRRLEGDTVLETKSEEVCMGNRF